MRYDHSVTLSVTFYESTMCFIYLFVSVFAKQMLFLTVNFRIALTSENMQFLWPAFHISLVCSCLTMYSNIVTSIHKKGFNAIHRMWDNFIEWPIFPYILMVETDKIDRHSGFACTFVCVCVSI